MGVYILPTFKGYTVDLRLRQFRRAVPHTILEFISFDDQKGAKLLVELKELAVKILATDS